MTGAGDRSTGRRAGVALAAVVVLAVGMTAVFGPRVYDWMKALHIVAVMSWMAGLLYLPRLFIYHCDAEPGSKQSETFKLMERRLLTVIMTPAMAITWGLGLWLTWQAGWHKAGWFLAKFLLVIALTGVHGHFAAAVRAFGEDRNGVPAQRWRMINEIPTVLMVLIVILVVVKPF